MKIQLYRTKIREVCNTLAENSYKFKQNQTNNIPHIMHRTYRFENLIKKNEGQMNAKVRKYANVK